MTQYDLSAQMQLLGVDVSEDHISRLESGMLRISVSEMFAISHILFIDLNRRASDYVESMISA